MPQSRFQKLPRLLLQPQKKKRRLLQLAAEMIRAQVEVPLYHPNLDRVAALPPEAQTVYWLWVFFCEANCGLMDVFILEPHGKHAPQIHAALTAVGAKELVRRLEAAIPHAREACAEFTVLPDQSWFNQFNPDPEFPTLESTNDGIYELIQSLPLEYADPYIRANERILFEE